MLRLTSSSISRLQIGGGLSSSSHILFNAANPSLIRAGAASRATGSTLIRRHLNISMVDWKPIKSKKTPGMNEGFGSKIFLGLLFLMPVISFGLGTWQVQRLQWKTNLIAQAENRLTLTPLPLPDKIDPAIVQSGEFDYRRVIVKGKFRHDQEMLVGPRSRGEMIGYQVVTPLERGDGQSKLLISRGWVSQGNKLQSSRAKGALPTEEVELVCLLQRNPGQNMFTPDDKPQIGEYYHMNIEEMARQTGSQPVYIQAMGDYEHNGKELLPEQMVRRGIPLGANGKVNIRNTHFQYILTWYGLSAITTIMFFTVLKSRGSTVNNALRQKLKHSKKFS